MFWLVGVLSPLTGICEIGLGETRNPPWCRSNPVHHRSLRFRPFRRQRNLLTPHARLQIGGQRRYRSEPHHPGCFVRRISMLRGGSELNALRRAVSADTDRQVWTPGVWRARAPHGLHRAAVRGGRSHSRVGDLHGVSRCRTMPPLPLVNLFPSRAPLTPQIGSKTYARTDVIPTQYRRDTDIEFAIFPWEKAQSLYPGPQALASVARAPH